MYYRVRLVTLGDTGSGKSAVVTSLLSDGPQECLKPTEGLQTTLWAPPGNI